jgi:hypothetical protein
MCVVEFLLGSLADLFDNPERSSAIGVSSGVAENLLDYKIHQEYRSKKLYVSFKFT